MVLKFTVSFHHEVIFGHTEKVIYNGLWTKYPQAGADWQIGRSESSIEGGTKVRIHTYYSNNAQYLHKAAYKAYLGLLESQIPVTMYSVRRHLSDCF